MWPEAPAPDDIARFQAGEAAAFEDLVARYARYLAAVARPFALDTDDVGELVQNAWGRIYEQRASFDGRGSLLGWMMAVCRRECLARLRHENARATAESRFSAESEQTMEPALPGDGGPLHAATAALPPRQRDAVLLRILEGRSTRETAEIMGCAEGTVKALLHQGVQNLRKSMGGPA